MNHMESSDRHDPERTRLQQALLEQLCETLEAQIDSLCGSRESLETLKSLLIRRDVPQWSALLEQMQARGQAYQALETRRQRLLSELAAAMGLVPAQLTARVLERQGKAFCPSLPSLLERLRVESIAFRTRREGCHAILRDCRNFNRRLLDQLRKRRPQSLTYDAGGQLETQRNASFINCAF